ncbi:hypothetical protein ACOSQ3_032832 [Xanthoceras sorbifolium]
MECVDSKGKGKGLSYQEFKYRGWLVIPPVNSKPYTLPEPDSNPSGISKIPSNTLALNKSSDANLNFSFEVKISALSSHGDVFIFQASAEECAKKDTPTSNDVYPKHRAVHNEKATVEIRRDIEGQQVEGNVVVKKKSLHENDLAVKEQGLIHARTMSHGQDDKHRFINGIVEDNNGLLVV